MKQIPHSCKLGLLCNKPFLKMTTLLPDSETIPGIGCFCSALLPARNSGEILARVGQTLSGRVPAIAATFRSALTELEPALSCHYPGQAGF